MRKDILNRLLDIGGVATKNNFYTPRATTKHGMFITANRNFKELLKDELIRPLPTITRPDCTREEIYYTITKAGAEYVGRKDEYRYKEPKSIKNVMHESMKYDVLLSLLRNFPDYHIIFEFNVSFCEIIPDAYIKMTHKKTLKSYEFLLETERKKRLAE